MSDRIFTNDLYQHGDHVTIYSESFARMGFAQSVIYIRATILTLDNLTITFSVHPTYATDTTPELLTLPWDRVLALEPSGTVVRDRIVRPAILARNKNTPIGKAAALVGKTTQEN